MYVYVRMDALICTCEYTCKGQRWTSSALSYHFPSYSLEAGSCTELGVGLVSSNISISSLCFYTRWLWGYRHLHMATSGFMLM